MKEKYSKLHTDRISVALAPLMGQSQVRIKGRIDRQTKEWADEPDEGLDMGVAVPPSNNANPAKENSDFWETNF